MLGSCTFGCGSQQEKKGFGAPCMVIPGVEMCDQETAGKLRDIQDTVTLRLWEGPWVEMSGKGVETQVQGWIHSWRRRFWRHQGAVMSIIQKRKKCRPSGNLSGDGLQWTATFTQREPGFLFFLPFSAPSWTLFSFVTGVTAEAVSPHSGIQLSLSILSICCEFPSFKMN